MNDTHSEWRPVEMYLPCNDISLLMYVECMATTDFILTVGDLWQHPIECLQQTDHKSHTVLLFSTALWNAKKDQIEDGKSRFTHCLISVNSLMNTTC